MACGRTDCAGVRFDAPPRHFTAAPILRRRLGALCRLWRERRRQRRALSHLDDRLLRDIGVTRLEAARGSRKPFWRG